MLLFARKLKMKRHRRTIQCKDYGIMKYITNATVSHGGNKEQIMSKRGEALKNAFPLI